MKKSHFYLTPNEINRFLVVQHSQICSAIVSLRMISQDIETQKMR